MALACSNLGHECSIQCLRAYAKGRGHLYMQIHTTQCGEAGERARGALVFDACVALRVEWNGSEEEEKEGYSGIYT